MSRSAEEFAESYLTKNTNVSDIVYEMLVVEVGEMIDRKKGKATVGDILDFLGVQQAKFVLFATIVNEHGIEEKGISPTSHAKRVLPKTFVTALRIYFPDLYMMWEINRTLIEGRLLEGGGR